MSTADNKILIGKIVAPQGIRGDVRVHTYTASPMDFRDMSVVCDRFAPADFKFVRRLNPTSDVIVAHIAGYDDRTAVESLRGAELYVMRDTLPAPASDEYYQADLIGFTVVRCGREIGRVDGFQNFGAGDIMELDNGDMVSFVGANVDMDGKKIMVD